MSLALRYRLWVEAITPKVTVSVSEQTRGVSGNLSCDDMMISLLPSLDERWFDTVPSPTVR
jgi:hypothetical protein